jgi:acid phosphatase type 7
MSNLRMVLLFTGIVFCMFFTQAIQAQQIVRGPYLQMPTHNSIIVRWRTDQPTQSKLTYGSSVNNQTEEILITTLTTEHEVKVEGLNPNTKYFYAVGNIVGLLSGPDNLHHFKTHPMPGQVTPLRAWVIGDQGKGNQGQKDVRDSYVYHSGNEPTDLWIWLGDNVYDDGTDQEFQEKSFEIYPNEKKYMPIWPTPGNHDYNVICPIPCDIDPMQHSGPYYDIMSLPKAGESGGVPSGTELYYSFDYGNARFISLNSELGSLDTNFNYIGADPSFLFPSSPASANDAEKSPMMQWLKADLADAHQKNRDWIVVFFHQAPYSKGSHDTDTDWRIFQKAMRENYLPVLEQAGVDLVMAGHSHVYERSFLLNGHYGVSSELTSEMLVDNSSGNFDAGEPYMKTKEPGFGGKGTVYAVVGNSGSRTTNPEMGHPVHYFGHGCSDCYGSLILEINGNRLNGTYLASDSTVMDEFTILKENTASSVTGLTDLLQDIKIYPNPFAGVTNIEYTLSASSDVKIQLFDISGKKIAVLAEYKNKKKGQHTFELQADKYSLSKGLYFVRISLNDKDYVESILKLN